MLKNDTECHSGGEGGVLEFNMWQVLTSRYLDFFKLKKFNVILKHLSYCTFIDIFIKFSGYRGGGAQNGPKI